MKALGRSDVRNPVLALSSAPALRALPPDVRIVLRSILLDLSRDANDRASLAWARKKAPMAAYWKACSVYAKHIARAL